jgi:hypothetical protein
MQLHRLILALRDGCRCTRITLILAMHCWEPTLWLDVGHALAGRPFTNGDWACQRVLALGCQLGQAPIADIETLDGV